MDKPPAEAVNGGVFLILCFWVLADIAKRRRREAGAESGSQSHGSTATTKSAVFTAVVLLHNAVLALSSAGLCVTESRRAGSPRLRSLFPALSWSIAAVYSVFAGNRTLRNGHGWPLVLVFWWVFSCSSNSLVFSVSLVTRIESRSFHGFLTLSDAVGITSLSFFIILCFRALWVSCAVEQPTAGDLRRPLLQEQNEDARKVDDDGAFVKVKVWSHLTFRWLNPLFEKGRARKLRLCHVPSVPPSERADEASSSLEASLMARKTVNSSLPEAIGHAVWKPLAINAIFAGVDTVTSYMGPFLIKRLVDFINGDFSSYGHGLSLALVFFLAKTVESLSQRQWHFGAQRLGVRARAALTVLIFRKSLSVRGAGQRNGTVTNLINVDAERIGDFFTDVHKVWLLPLQVALALAILYINLGAAPSAAALSATVLVVAVNTPLAGMQKGVFSKIMEARDSRIKATSECLRSIRILKLHSWESSFMEKILRLRGAERSWLKKYLYTCSAVAFLFWVSPMLISVVTFGVCVAMKTPLTAGTVLSALATFRILQEPIYNLPDLISMVAQTKVSIDRTQAFLREEDQPKLPVRRMLEGSDTAIEVEPGEYIWETNDSSSRSPALEISKTLKILKGQKIAICGSVGSGKTSLLCSILGEMPRIHGKQIKVYGSKAYVPQSAWIQTGTVRENVLFGKTMEKAFYGDVLERCALDRDVSLWGDGDLTAVGERGLNLSGGQKQRIQLARAIYSDSDVYLLDDPFSAVDAHTGAHLFKRCLVQALSQKTVLYTTHQLEFLEASDLVLVMKDGRIVEHGKFRDLISFPSGELSRQMLAHRKSLNQANPTRVESSVSAGGDEEDGFEEIGGNFEDSIDIKQPQDEETESGRVKWRVYSTLVTCAFRGALVPVILLCQILFQGLQMGSNYWITWATAKHGRISDKKLIGVFALLSCGSSIFILARAVLLSTIAIETAQRLFRGMLTSVFQAPILFFDSTPSSRILSRSSTDQSIVDVDIPYRLAGLAFALIQLFSIITLISQVAWQIFLIFMGVLAISLLYQAYYITTARELARMVGTQKAPLVHHFSESINGVATVRCFGQEERFLKKTLSLIDDYSRAVFHNNAAMEWLCVRINFLFNIVFFVVLVILVSLPKSALNPSLAGLAATYGLNMNVLQGWVIWNLCNVENKIISVERILQFSNLASEAPAIIEDFRPPTDWPEKGRIELENLQIRYSPSLPVILKNITCNFPGEKMIGVVGRTGGGKSTLIQALFRLVEPSGGRILIDGVDISKMGLQDLRSRLSIIPQDPTLFQGTVRMNVDPLQQHSDHEIWEVLRKCRLVVRQDQRFLDVPVAEDGQNWSVGQRQLICLGRVLLQRRRILVLDEATASVDTETDNLIQKTIREETKRCTVITIAHRIPTVMDNDLVLVLDEGTIAEYDSPARLLHDSSSAFSKLVMESTKSSSKSYQC